MLRRGGLPGGAGSITVTPMDHIVCLIAQPTRETLDQALVIRLARALAATPRWLADGEACELPVTGIKPADSVARARAAVGDRAIDACVVPARDRAKRLLLCDLDSTIITIETIDELADLVGVKAEVAAITRRAMRGELAFGPALEARVALLAGLPETMFEDIYRDRARLMPGARTLVRTMRAGARWRGAHRWVPATGGGPRHRHASESERRTAAVRR